MQLLQSIVFNWNVNCHFIVQPLRPDPSTLGQVQTELSVSESLTSVPCYLCFFRIKESSGWQQVFTSPYLDWTIERVALNAKVVGGPHGDKDKMVAVASESSIILWSIQDGGSGSEIGNCLFYFIFMFNQKVVCEFILGYRE